MLLSYFCALSFLLSNNKLDFVEKKKGIFLLFCLKKIFLVCPRETLKKIKFFLLNVEVLILYSQR